MLDTRSDLGKYASACRRLENMIATIYGPVTRRPGTKYIAPTKGASVRLIDFIYNPTTAYVCEFGEQYIRVYSGGATPALVAEIVTPYAAADLPALQYRQIGASMWLIHPTYAPRWLKLEDSGNFTLTVIPFTDGPFLVQNDLDLVNGIPGVTLESSVYNQGDSGTLTAAGVDPSIFSFEAGHVGSLWQIVLPRSVTSVKITAYYPAAPIQSDSLDNVKGTINLTTGGSWSGTLLIERNNNGQGWMTYSTFVSIPGTLQNFTSSITENDDNVSYRLNYSIGTSGTITANLYVSESEMAGIVRIDSVVSAQVAGITVMRALDNSAPTTPTLKWSEGSWSGVRGYPAAVGMIQSRVVYGGTDHQPTTVWFSTTDDFENFAVGTQDDQAFEEQLTTANQIQWIEALQALAIGTSGDEWVISTNSLNNPFTPTTVQGIEQATYGSAPMQPIKAHKSVLFLDSVRRKLRELTYVILDDQYHAPDLFALAEHISAGGIEQMAYQQHPDSIIWAVRSDGMLLSCAYEREQNVVAWSRHPMGAATVKSVCVIPGTDEDEVWLVVQRTNGLFIEQMQPRADQWFVDCGVAYGAVGPTFTGLDHLEGLEVAVNVDGSDRNRQTVTNGQITIDSAAATTGAIIGLPFTYLVEPVRLDTRGPKGDSHGSITKVTEVGVSFYETTGAQYGTDENNLWPIQWRTTEKYGTPTTLFTGDKALTFRGGYSTNQTLVITGDDTNPCTVRAIVVRGEQAGR